MRFAALALAVLSLGACAQIENKLNAVNHSMSTNLTPKTVTLYSQTGTPVKTYDIGHTEIERGGSGGASFITFFSSGKQVQTNLPYLVEYR